VNARNGDDDGPRRRSKRNRRGRARPSQPSTARTSGDFWGDVDKLPSVDSVTLTPDPSAVVRSLGRPPLAGHEAVSEHYFRAIYEQVVTLAGVLATAGDLIDADELTGD
jgi:hypothetical protein